MSKTFTSLPLEVRLQVFDSLNDNVEDFYQCMLVSKEWVNPFRKKLYERVEISSFSQLSKLYTILKKDKQLGSLVSSFELFYQADFEKEGRAVYWHIFHAMPCLQRVRFSDHSYFSFLYAALNMGALPLLTHIGHPVHMSDLTGYRNCIRSVGARSGMLAFVHQGLQLPQRQPRFTAEGDAFFNGDFSMVKVCKNLEDLSLKTISGNEINQLETATEYCKFLKCLDLTFYPLRNVLIDRFDLEKFTPAKSVKELTFHEGVIHNAQLTDYMMHKFPKLDSLALYENSHQRSRIDELQFKKLLTYLSKIRKVYVQYIPFNNGAMINSIGEFWKTMSKSCLVSVEFRYELSSTRVNTMKIDIQDKINVNLIRYPKRRKGTAHLDLIAKYGQFIDTLAVYNARNIPKGSSSFETLVIQSLRCCPKLTRLSILATNLGGTELRDYALDRIETFEHLSIMACTIEDDTVFEKMSSIFASINYMELYAVRYETSSKGQSFMNIHMKQTAIGTLSLSTKANFSNSCHHYKLLVKLTTQSDGDCYMCFSLSENKLQVNKISDYMFDSIRSDHKNFMFDLNFKSLDKLKIEHFESEFESPIPLLLQSTDADVEINHRS